MSSLCAVNDRLPQAHIVNVPLPAPLAPDSEAGQAARRGDDGEASAALRGGVLGPPPHLLFK